MRKQPAKKAVKKAADQGRERGEETLVNRGRHEFRCSICTHAQRDLIDSAFIGWQSPAKIGHEYGVTRDAIYRHASATKLMDKRRRNLRGALEKIIEHAGEVEISGAVVVSAIVAYGKLNSRGEIVERHESEDVNALFAKMTPAELEEYAKGGRLPAWFSAATTVEGLEDEANA
jgi:hypothetical protein